MSSCSSQTFGYTSLQLVTTLKEYWTLVQAQVSYSLPLCRSTQMKLKTQQVSGLSKLASHATFTYDAQGTLIVLAEFYPSAEVVGTGQ